MWSRPAAALGLLLGLAAISTAQNPQQAYSRALPPDKAQLDRLNLRTEWSLYLPIASGRDSIDLIQTFDDQIFVQTRTGLFVAIDARTGKILWSASLGNGGYTNVHQVAVNSQFVFVSNVTQLFAFHRYSGVTEFSFDMTSVPTVGLAADETGMYVVLAVRPGTAGSQRIVAYDIPPPISIPDPAKVAAAKGYEKDKKTVNPIDALTNRYPAAGVPRGVSQEEQFERSGRKTSVNEAPTGGLSGSRSPSLAITPTVTPPYMKEGGPFSPSISVLSSFRQPYHLRDASSQNVQRTPSIASIPPSVAAALSLTDLRPRGVQPKLRWEYGLTSRVMFTPNQGQFRLWVVTDGRAFVALSKDDKNDDKRTTVSGPLWDHVAALPAQAETFGYVPLVDGTLIAVDLSLGSEEGGLNVPWRVNVGGLPNRTPVLTKDAVFTAGDNSGIVRVDRTTGNIVWRTDRGIDRVAAVNQDFLYARDRQGKLLVFDAKRATDPSTGRAVPLTSMNVAEFNVPVVNTVSDRVYLAADNGLLVCLRDAGRKYDAPVRMAPEAIVNLPTKAGVQFGGVGAGVPMMPMMPMGMMPPPN